MGGHSHGLERRHEQRPEAVRVKGDREQTNQKREIDKQYGSLEAHVPCGPRRMHKKRQQSCTDEQSCGPSLRPSACFEGVEGSADKQCYEKVAVSHSMTGPATADPVNPTLGDGREQRNAKHLLAFVAVAVRRNQSDLVA